MSVKIIAVSHGRFSEGLVDSVQMLAGEQKDLVYYGLFPEETVDDLREKLRAELEATPEDMEVLFLSDVFHGSPFNTIVDDEVANDSFNKRVIKALAPNGVKCNVYSVEKGADITLGILAENDGRFPDSAFSKQEAAVPAVSSLLPAHCDCPWCRHYHGYVHDRYGRPASLPTPALNAANSNGHVQYPGTGRIPDE